MDKDRKSGVLIRDMNNDGNLDLIINSRVLRIYSNDGDGISFYKEYERSFLDIAVVEVADLDGDGSKDIILSEVLAQRDNQVYFVDNGKDTRR